MSIRDVLGLQIGEAALTSWNVIRDSSCCYKSLLCISVLLNHDKLVIKPFLSRQNEGVASTYLRSNDIPSVNDETEKLRHASCSCSLHDQERIKLNLTELQYVGDPANLHRNLATKRSLDDRLRDEHHHDRGETVVSSVRHTSAVDMFVTYAAVAAKTSVLELVPCVRKIRPAAKTTANPVMHRRRSRVRESCLSTTMATTGIKQAKTVDKLEVRRSAAPSDLRSTVLRCFGCVSCFGLRR